MPLRTLTYSPSRALLTVAYDYGTGSARAWRTDTSVFEAFDPAHAASYGIATAAAGVPGEYQWAVPGLPALAAPAEYKAVTYDVTGTTLSAALAGTPVAVWIATFGWDGSGPVDWARTTNPVVVIQPAAPAVIQPASPAS